MTQEEFGILTRDKIRQLIEANLETNPIEFALTHSTNEISSALVSTQLKNLQKAKKKCPSYYLARCIIPTFAYEQASSELAASFKSVSGTRCLDLTMGLGVDTIHFAKQFEEVIALEPNPVLAEIGRYNMQLMGISNVKIFSQTAEMFLSAYKGEKFDLIYVDPSRRDSKGKRVFLLEACQPNLLDLMPHMLAWGKEVLVKLSPLFDLHEAARQFSQLDNMTVVSIGNDCKELLIHICNKKNRNFPTSEIALDLQLVRHGSHLQYSFPFPLPQLPASDLPSVPRYLYEADVAFYKTQSMPHLMTDYFPQLPGAWNHPMGFFFSEEIAESFPGRVWQIQEIHPYKPRQLRKWLTSTSIQQAHLLRREFPLTVKQIRQQLRIWEGGETYLICTNLGGTKHLIQAHLIR